MANFPPSGISRIYLSPENGSRDKQYNLPKAIPCYESPTLSFRVSFSFSHFSWLERRTGIFFLLVIRLPFSFPRFMILCPPLNFARWT